MKTQHTPGPWIATDTTNTHFNAVGYKLGDGIKVAYDGPDHHWHIADVFGQMDGSKPLATRHGYAEANARLIAAAPDLLAALVRARDHVVMQGTLQTDRDEALAEIRAAIAKATTA